jgi:hypothetical protein
MRELPSFFKERDAAKSEGFFTAGVVNLGVCINACKWQFLSKNTGLSTLQPAQKKPPTSVRGFVSKMLKIIYYLNCGIRS